MNAKRYATFTKSNGEISWYVFSNRYQAKKAIDNGLTCNSSGKADVTSAYPVNYTGQILTERQMRREELI
jgi:hypothetical protein